MPTRRFELITLLHHVQRRCGNDDAGGLRLKNADITKRCLRHTDESVTA
jgi:hypothetical protein